MKKTLYSTTNLDTYAYALKLGRNILSRSTFKAVLISLIFSLSGGLAIAQTCDNLTSAGVIAGDETQSGPFTPSTITSVSLPSGGSGTIEYVWLSNSTPATSGATTISGANSSTYTPGLISQTTYFRRCARRSGCSNYVGESNWIKKEVAPICTNLIVAYTGNCNDPEDALYPSSLATCLSTASWLMPTNGPSNASCDQDIICIATTYNDWDFTINASQSFDLTQLKADFLYPINNPTAGGGANSSSCPTTFDYKVEFYLNNVLLETINDNVPADVITTEYLTPSSPISVAAGDSVRVVIIGIPTSTSCDLFELAGLEVLGCCSPSTCDLVVDAGMDQTIAPGQNVTLNATVTNESSCSGTISCVRHAATVHSSAGSLIDNPEWGLDYEDSKGVKFNRGSGSTTTKVIYDMAESIPQGTAVTFRLKLEHCSNTSQSVSNIKFWGSNDGSSFTAEGTYSTSNGSYHDHVRTFSQAYRYLKITDEQGCAFRIDAITWTKNNCGIDCNSVPSYTGMMYLGTYNNKAYYKRTAGDQLYWDAKEYAHENGGSLPVIEDASHNSWLNGVTNGDIWLGYSDNVVNQTWKWIYGETYSYTNWRSGEPSNNSDEDFGRMRSDGTWTDQRDHTDYNWTVVEIPCNTGATNSNVTYAWSTGASTQSIQVNPTVNSTYIVTATDCNNCTDEDTVQVIIGCDNVTSGGVIAADETFSIPFWSDTIRNVTFPSGGTGTLEYIWLQNSTPSLTGATIIAGSTSSSYYPGFITQNTYFIRCARRFPCDNYVGESNWVAKIIDPNACNISVYLGNDQSVTAGQSVTLTAAVSNATTCNAPNNVGVSYIWSTGDTTASITVSPISTTQYSVSVMDCDSCSASDDVTITVPQVSGPCDDVLVEWDLDACLAFSGANDYSEFTATYPSTSSCAGITASNIYRDNPSSNGHSCTPGVSGSTAGMCIGSLNSCSFADNSDKALKFNVTITPNANGVGKLSKLSFFQKAPLTAYQINVSNGIPNNYPTKYGVRVTVNGNEVYKCIDLPTTTSWTQQLIDFSSDPDFTVTSATTFDFELLPYCLVGNGNNYEIWDVDEFELIGCCDSIPTCQTDISISTSSPTITVGQTVNLSTSLTGESTCGQTCCTRTVSNTVNCSGGYSYNVWLKDNTGSTKHYAYQALNWEECGDSVSITGTALANDGSGEVLTVDVLLTGKTAVAPLGSPKHRACGSTNATGWVYYTNTSGTLTSSNGGSYTVNRKGEAFQVGNGANVTSTSSSTFGGSGWFDLSGGTGTTYYTNGDFNLNLGTACTGSTSPTSAVTYTWSNGAGNVNATSITEAGTYYVTVVDCDSCVDVDSITVTFDCTADAGSLLPAASHMCFDNSMSKTLTATVNTAPTVPSGFETLYVLTKGTNLVIEQTNTSPSFTVTSTGDYKIHTLIAEISDPNSPYYLDLSIVVPGTTTGGDVYSLLIPGGGSICGDLDVIGAPTTVDKVDVSISSPSTSIIVGSTMALTANVTGQSDCGTNSNVSYAWSTGGTNDTIQIHTFGTYYVTVTDCKGCMDVDSITILNGCDNVTDPGAIARDQFDCGSFNPSIITDSISPSGGSGAFEYQWISNSTPDTTGATVIAGANSATYDPSVVTSTTYFARQVRRFGCTEFLNSNWVEMEVRSIPNPPSGNSPQTFCWSDSATIADLVITGTNITWYATNTSTTSLPTSTTLVNGTFYYASSTVNGCESSRITIKAVVTPDAPPVGPSPQKFCADDNPTIADLNGGGVNEKWYATLTSIPTLPLTTPLVDGVTYYVTSTINNCESSRHPITVIIRDPKSGTLTADAANICLDESATISASYTTLPTIPAGYETLYFLTFGNSKTVIDTSSSPSFIIDEAGNYAIHSLIGELSDNTDPEFLDISSIVFDTSTIHDVYALTNAGGGLKCAGLDTSGAPIEVVKVYAGTLNPDFSHVCISNGTATISATHGFAPIVPPNYELWYLLAEGPNDIIVDIATSPSFTVTTAGEYSIHTFVAETDDNTDPNYFDPAGIIFDTTSTNDIYFQTIIAGGTLCADIDLVGAKTLATDLLADLNASAMTIEFGDTIDLTATFTGAATCGQNSNVTYAWSTGAGNVSSTTTTMAGTYWVTITDCKGCVDSASVTIQDGNVPPIAQDDINNTLENTPVNGNVLTNDYDPNGDPINVVVSVSPYNGPSNGTLTLNVNGTYTYTPNTGFLGTDVFTYVIEDPAGLRDTADVTIIVEPNVIGNTPPVANPDATSTPLNTPVTLVVLANDFDVDLGDTVRLIINPIISSPSNGTVVVNANGSVTYTPDLGFLGIDQFTYVIRDIAGATDTAIGEIDVRTPIFSTNNPPSAIDDGTSTLPNVPVNFSVASNDSDPDLGDILTWTKLTNPANGTLLFLPNGDFTYTPDSGYVGPDNFTYFVCDDGTPVLCDTATAYITIFDPNDPPVAQDDINNTLLNTPVNGNVLTNDTDPNNDPLSVVTSISPYNGPSNGTVILNANGSYTYTPNAGFIGTDVFTYVIEDPSGLRDTADVTIVVEPNVIGNTPPVANEDATSTPLNTPVTLVVLANDFDNDLGDTVRLVINPIISSPSNGTVVVNANGSVTYTPNLGFLGIDQFTYVIRDIAGATDTAIGEIDVRTPIFSTNNPPSAVDDATNTLPNTPVSSSVATNDSDPDSLDVLTWTKLTNPVNGTVVFLPNGDFTYTPNPGYQGPDNFIYFVCDDGTPVLCDTATAYITIFDPNDPPVAQDDVNTTLLNTSVNGNVLTNDTDPNNDPLNVVTSISPYNGPSNGSVILNADGSYTYTPNTGFLGSDVFTYVIEDPSGLRDTAHVTIDVTPLLKQNRPKAINDAISTPLNTPVTLVVLANDYDIDPGDVVSLITNPIIIDVSNGSTTINPDGSIKYTPNTGFIGLDQFTYVIEDLTGLRDTALGIIDVRPVIFVTNDPPTAVDDVEFTTLNTSIMESVATNDSDPDSADILTWTKLTDPDSGTVSFSPNGDYTYTPNTGFTGPDNFIYYVCDNGTPVLCDTATVYILVAKINLPPVATDDFGNTPQGIALTSNVYLNDSDPNAGDTLTFTLRTSPNNGSVSLNSNGVYTYTPNAGFSGQDTFSYHVCDNGIPVLCDSAFVFINVIGLNSPVANIDRANGCKNVPVAGNAGVNDSDPDGDPLTWTLLTSGNYGTLTLDSTNGAFTYIPDSNYIGADTMTYQVCDTGMGAAPKLCANSSIIITIIECDSNTTFANYDNTLGPRDSVQTGNVLTNDFDSEGDNQFVDTVLVKLPTNGTVTIDINGNFAYTPNPGYVGNDHFIYSIYDDGTPNIATDTALVCITVLYVNDPPVATDDFGNTPQGIALDNLVYLNDNDPNPIDTLSFSLRTNPSNGTVSMTSTGLYTYTPNATFSGVDTFSYYVCDNGIPVLCDSAFVFINVIGLNSPVANIDRANGCKNVTVTGNAGVNDSDPDGDPLTWTLLSNGNHGTLTLDSTNGAFTYIPDSNYVGADTMTYQVCDTGMGAAPKLCANSSIIITMIKCDSNTTFANYDNTLGPRDSVQTGNVLTNDFDSEGDNQFVDTVLVKLPTNGTVTIDINGNFVYTPNAGYVGNDHFIYSIYDDGTPNIATDTALVCITVLYVNDPPVAEDDFGNTPQGIALTSFVYLNDYDPNPIDTLTFSLRSSPNNGNVTMNTTGDYTYVPNKGFSGQDTFSYYVCDNGIPVLCDSAFVFINVIGLNSPVANIDRANGCKNVTVTGNAGVNDSDPDGDPLTWTLLSNGNHGTLTLDSTNGAFTYIPDSNYVGADTMTYQVCDTGMGAAPKLCANSSIIITMIECDSNTTFANYDNTLGPRDSVQTGNVLTNDFDSEGDNQFVDTVLVKLPTNGTVTIDINGNFVYTPNPGYVGNDHFIYSIYDDGTPNIATDTALVCITVLYVNDPPVAEDDFGNTPQGIALTSFVYLNDYDPNPIDTLSFSLRSTPSNGTVTMNSTGNYTYVPAKGFSGIDTFSYYVCDNGSPVLCDSAFVFINVIGLNSPVANIDRANGCKNVTVTGNAGVNDSDPDGDPLTWTLLSNGNHGTLTLDSTNGAFTYVPDSNYVGADTMTYQVCDTGMGAAPKLCANSSIIITMIKCDSNTTFANYDNTLGDRDSVQTGNVLTNDFDSEGDNQFVDTVLVKLPTNGTVTIDINGNFVYTPNPGYVGNDHFIYSIYDDGTPNIATDTALVCITVLYVNDPPVAVDDFGNTPCNTPFASNVSLNDSDPNADSLSWSLLTTPNNGTVSMNPDGSYTYTPNTLFSGQDTFSYTLCDNGSPNLCANAFVFINIIGCIQNNPPVANIDRTDACANRPINGNVGANDADPDGDPLTWSLISGANNGTIVINANGTFTYTPDSFFVGLDTMVYQVCDTGGLFGGPLCANASLIINVISCDSNTTFANYDNTLGYRNDTQKINVLLNDIDAEGDSQFVTMITKLPSNGTVTLDVNGNMVYVPDSGFVGNDHIIYQICDNGTPNIACDTALVCITVLPPLNNPPRFIDSVGNDIDTMYITVLENTTDTTCPMFTDPDLPNDVLTCNIISNPSNGTASLDANNCVVYTPNNNFVGIDVLIKTVCDTSGACDTLVMIYNIIPVDDCDRPFAKDFFRTITNLDSAVFDVISLALDFGNPINYVGITQQGTNGITTINDQNELVYKPDPLFTGQDIVLYEVGNVCGLDTALLVLTIVDAEFNDPPEILEDPEDQGPGPDVINYQYCYQDTGNGFAGPLKECFGVTDPNNDPITVKVLTDANDGLFELTNVCFVYTPNDPNYTTQYFDSVQVEACDNGNPNLCDTAWLVINNLVCVVGPIPEFYIPNAFSPNEDDVNEEFFITGLKDFYPDATLKVYNRWGDEIFDSVGPYDNKWNGTYGKNGENVPDGTYYYLLEPNDGETETFAGFLSIQR